MVDSILVTIKHMLGIEDEYEVFDIDIINGINTAIMALNQLGVGEQGFIVYDKSSKWEDFVDIKRFPAVINYVYMKTKLAFDSASSSGTYVNALTEQIKELEFRLNVEAETPFAYL